MGTEYGSFTAGDREFTIQTPDTPAPWINYLFGRNLRAFISQAAGGCAWFSEADVGRLTRYRFNGMPVDSPGFYLYIVDGASAWNPSFRPTRTPLDAYSCTHGLGYTRFDSRKDDLEASVTYFIPPDNDVLIWDLRLRNRSATPKDIRLLSYVEFSLNVQSKDGDAYHVCGHQWRTTFEPALNGAHVDYFAFESPITTHSFFTVSDKVTAYELDREVFAGPGRSEMNPLALERPLRNSQVPDGGGYPCGCLENRLRLQPGEERRIIYKLAVAERQPDAEAILAKFAKADAVDAAFAALRAQWDRTLGLQTLRTPDPDLDAFVGCWLPYNTNVTALLARTISARHPGGGGAIRFRDTMQDLMPGAFLFPERTRATLLKVFGTMLQSGRTVMGVSTRTMKADNTSFTRIDAALWGVFTTHKYLAETGDWALLEEKVPYFDGGSGTVLEHLERAMAFIAEHRGPHGLPLLFDVDWNDMLQLFTHYEKGPWESVMVAEQFIYATRLMKEIAGHTGQGAGITQFEAKSAEFAKVLESEVCWDGRWFRRLLLNDRTMGSAANAEGRLFLNTQSWAVLCGALDPAKCRTAMDSVADLLDTPYGIRIFTPPFTRKGDGSRFDSNQGGAGENGGLFLHANTWAIIAEAVLGRPERSWKYFSQILPPKRAAADADLYALEPYAFASWVYGPDHSRFGRGQLSWLTGGAAWLHIAANEYILGIRPTLAGLSIKPMIPPEWPGFSVRRRVRGKDCYIDVARQVDGRLRVDVNGSRLDGDFLAYERME
jgi:cellobiose phosphorylase